MVVGGGRDVDMIESVGNEGRAKSRLFPAIIAGNDPLFSLVPRLVLARYTDSICTVRREDVSVMVAGQTGQAHWLSHKDLQNRRRVWNDGESITGPSEVTDGRLIRSD